MKQKQNRNNAPDTLKLKLELKSFDQTTGEFSGYAAVFGNVDLLGDICHQGCFKSALETWANRETMPRVRWRHGLSIGHISEIQEDSQGLFVKGKIWLDNADDIAWWETVKTIHSLSMSFGFWAIDYEIKDNIRHLYTVELDDDITLTVDPVNPESKVIEAKSSDLENNRSTPGIRQTELILRDAGFSRKEAKSLLANGYTVAQRDVDQSLENVADQVSNLILEIQNL